MSAPQDIIAPQARRQLNSIHARRLHLTTTQACIASPSARNAHQGISVKTLGFQSPRVSVFQGKIQLKSIISWIMVRINIFEFFQKI